MRVISDRSDEFGNPEVVVALDPAEFEAFEEATDAEVPAKYHVDHYSDPGGSFETWREAAEWIVEHSDYSLLVESVSLRRVEDTETEEEDA